MNSTTLTSITQRLYDYTAETLTIPDDYKQAMDAGTPYSFLISTAELSDLFTITYEEELDALLPLFSLFADTRGKEWTIEWKTGVAARGTTNGYNTFTMRPLTPGITAHLKPTPPVFAVSPKPTPDRIPSKTERSGQHGPGESFDW